MSGPDLKSVTLDSLGTAPATQGLTFKLKWKNSGEANTDENNIIGNNVTVTISDSINCSENLNWSSFRKHVLAAAASSINDRITYVDSDGDEIPIESQCEFEEALKFAKKRAIRKRDVYLMIEKSDESEIGKTKEDTVDSRKDNNDFLETVAIPLLPKQTHNTMPPMKLDSDVQEFRQAELQPKQSCNVTKPDCSDEAAPKWFTSYMQTMKEDIVAEVSKRVTKTVMDALHNQHNCQYDSMTSHHHASDSKCVDDSDVKEDTSQKRCLSKTRNDFVLAEKMSSKILEGQDKRIIETLLRSSNRTGVESSRRRSRHAEKQHKKYNKNVATKNSISSEFWYSSSTNWRRSEKHSKNRHVNDSRTVPDIFKESGRSMQPSSGKNSCGPEDVGNEVIDLPRRRVISSGIIRAFSPDVSTQQSSGKNSCGSEDFGNEVIDLPRRRVMSSGIIRAFRPDVDSTDLPESPVLKLRSSGVCHESGNAEPKKTEEKLRMGCSVTGHDMLEQPNDRMPEYCAHSDSDNISIISDVSHTSEQLENNVFEKIFQRSMNLEEIDDERFQRISSEIALAEQDIYDNEVACDSSSFELLSETPSPPLSIHMDEDHFSPGENETSNYNINDDTKTDKRGNLNKIEVCPYGVDGQGKIYKQNIMDFDDECIDITLEKRSGGSYSFIGETLPGLTKESITLPSQSSASNNDASDTMRDSGHQPDLNTSAHVNIITTTTTTTTSTHLDPQSQRDSNDEFHESTQSFHSHTAPQAKNERQDFTSSTSSSRREETASTSRSHVFVDHNASKGLGDTKRSSPRKQSATSNKNFYNWRSERPRWAKKPYHESTNGSGNRNRNPRNGEGSSPFANNSNSAIWRTQIIEDLVMNSVDPMHILPETLITGAVHVASSAYTTARRVYDKLRPPQTGKPLDKSKFGRR